MTFYNRKDKSLYVSLLCPLYTGLTVIYLLTKDILATNQHALIKIIDFR